MELEVAIELEEKEEEEERGRRERRRERMGEGGGQEEEGRKGMSRKARQLFLLWGGQTLFFLVTARGVQGWVGCL